MVPQFSSLRSRQLLTELVALRIDMKRPLWMWVAVTALVAWSAVFIYHTSFLLNGVRYTCLFDDAMISMAYARNLTEGHGLNWARWGRPVEGYSHPLWVALMAIPNAAGVPIPWRSLVIQLFSLTFLVANLFVIESFIRKTWPQLRGASLVAVVATAAYYPLNHWALQGMESSLHALLLMMGLGAAAERSNAGLIKLGGIGAAATLLRMDLWIPVVLLFMAAGPTLWRANGRTRAIALGALLVPNLAYAAFRWIYFNDVLPNTYYLKLAGTQLDVRVLRGLQVFAGFAQAIWPLLVAGALAAAATWKTQVVRWMFVIVASQFAYAIWVGGDAWEWSSVGANRFYCVVMPLLFILIAAAIELRFRMAANPWAALTIACLVVLASNGLLSRDWRPHYDNLILRNPPLHVPDHRRVLREVLELKYRVPPQTRVAVVWAGIPAFFSDFPMVDVLGFNDRVIARLPAAPRPYGDAPDSFLPGHMKFDLPYTLDTLQTDVFYQSWEANTEVQTQLRRRRFRRVGPHFWFREGLPTD